MSLYKYLKYIVDHADQSGEIFCKNHQLDITSYLAAVDDFFLYLIKNHSQEDESEMNQYLGEYKNTTKQYLNNLVKTGQVNDKLHKLLMDSVNNIVNLTSKYFPQNDHLFVRVLLLEADIIEKNIKNNCKPDSNLNYLNNIREDLLDVDDHPKKIKNKKFEFSPLDVIFGFALIALILLLVWYFYK